MVDSRIPGFYGWPLEERRAMIAGLLGSQALEHLDPNALELSLADKLIENVVGVLGLPVGIGLNFRMNNQDYLVPMAVEEPSIVAAFSHAAKLARQAGGFFAQADPSWMIGQIQLTAQDEQQARQWIEKLQTQNELVEKTCRQAAISMEKRGGGYKKHEYRFLTDPEGGPPMVVIHVFVDVVNAMGANLD